MSYTLVADPLIKTAKATTGLKDFDGDAWKEGLDALIYSLNNDISLNEGNFGHFQGVIIQLLVNRLEIKQLLGKHPEIMEEKIEKPIFITGLPRTGTSITQTLLSLDPLSRYIRNWESSTAICPPPELLHSSVDPRIQAYHTAMEGFFEIMPHLRGMNGINFMADGPAECQNLMAHDFIHFGYSAGSSLFSYGEWLSECNMAMAYQTHKKLLKILQWKMPNEKWVLKAPIHLFGLDHLLETYPDAKIVFTHRDPLKAMSSGASMVYHWTLFSTQQADKSAIAQWWPKIWAKGFEKALKVRENFNPSQFYDLYHKDISQDPIKTVCAVYDHFDIPVGQGHLKRMQAWLRDNPRSRFGNHVHTLKEFELNSKKVREAFAFYQNRFNI